MQQAFPVRRAAWLRPPLRLVCSILSRAHGLRIEKEGLDGLRPPYLLLCSHHSFADYFVTESATGHAKAVNISELNDFVDFGMNFLMTRLGCLKKRKLVSDPALVRQVRQTLARGEVMVLYPEGRYSPIGTNGPLTDSLWKLIRMSGVPVVVLNMHGNYLTQPYWRAAKARVPLRADMRLALSAEEARTLPPAEIAQRVEALFAYDEYRWQRENQVAIPHPKRAEGLHHVLYRCAHCQTEFQMSSRGDGLYCAQCGAQWHMDAYGVLHGSAGGFSHIPDWNEFQRAALEQEILAGNYAFSAPVRVQALPSSKGFVELGQGHLRHGPEGFCLTYQENGAARELRLPNRLTCHVEYNFRGQGPCVSLSTHENTFYLFPESDRFSPSKITLATEEFHRLARAGRS